jgi:hypothetical protein
MRRGLAIYRDQGRNWLLSTLEAALAEAEASAGETNAGLRRLDDALAELEDTEARWYEAEMHRIRAEILLKHDPADTAAAERSLQAAIAIAQSQKARSFELRGALSLAKLYGQSRRRCAQRAGAGDRGLPADPTIPRIDRGANPASGAQPLDRWFRRANHAHGCVRLSTSEPILPRMTGLGAFRLLPSVPAKVGLLNLQPRLGPGDGSYSSCPIAVIARPKACVAPRSANSVGVAS